jgi:hypothetical protein
MGFLELSMNLPHIEWKFNARTLKSGCSSLWQLYPDMESRRNSNVGREIKAEGINHLQGSNSFKLPLSLPYPEG